MTAKRSSKRAPAARASGSSRPLAGTIAVGKKDRNFLESESPLFVGRAVAALAADPNVLTRTGQLLSCGSSERTRRFRDKLPAR